MTPQLAARLTIHENAGQVPAFAAAPSGAVDGGAIALPPRRLRLIQGGERTLSRLQRESRRRRLLGAADVLALTAAQVLVLSIVGSGGLGFAVALGMPLVVLLFKVAGLYDRDQLRLASSTLDEAPALVQLTGLYALGVAILHSALHDATLSGGQIAALWGAGFVATVAGRMLARWLAGRTLPPERCLVIGEREQADRIRERLGSNRAHAAVVATLPLASDEIERLGSPDGIRSIVDDLQLHRIILAPTTTEGREVAELIRIAKAGGVQVSVLPRMFEAVGSAVEPEDVNGMTMLGVRPFGLSRSSQALKRAFDLLAAGVGVTVAAPFVALIALAIKLDSRGPVLFRQARVGRNGRQFQILKFRSMVAGADRQKDGLRGRNEVGEGMFKISEDPRVTRVGSLLRRTSLDELPQVFNVLRGDMSLVGPRPLVVDEDAQVVGLDRSRLHLTPGMTGPWQVLGTRVPMREMVGIDYLYVANWSLWLDVKLLLQTVRHVLRGGNV